MHSLNTEWEEMGQSEYRVGGDSYLRIRAVTSFPITLSSDSLHSAQSLVLSIPLSSTDGCSVGLGKEGCGWTRLSLQIA